MDGFLGNLRDYENFIITDSVFDVTPTNNTLGNIARPSGTTTVTSAVGTLILMNINQDIMVMIMRNHI